MQGEADGPAPCRAGYRHARRRICPCCAGGFWLEDIDTNGVVRRVIGCPMCGRRWREQDRFSFDASTIYRAIDEVGTDIKLTTRSWVEFPIPGDSPCRSHSLAPPPICIKGRETLTRGLRVC